MTSMPTLMFTIDFEHAADKNSPQSKGRGWQAQARNAAGDGRG